MSYVCRFYNNIRYVIELAFHNKWNTTLLKCTYGATVIQFTYNNFIFLLYIVRLHIYLKEFLEYKKLATM